MLVSINEKLFVAGSFRPAVGSDSVAIVGNLPSGETNAIQVRQIGPKPSLPNMEVSETIIKKGLQDDPHMKDLVVTDEEYMVALERVQDWEDRIKWATEDAQLVCDHYNQK